MVRAKGPGRGTPLNLRDYQSALKADIFAAWQRSARVVCGVLPTGGGKTVVFAEILKEFPGVCFAIAHRQELLSQISLALARDEVPHRIISRSNIIRWIDSLHYAEFKRSFINPHARCVVLGVDTLMARAEKIRDLCESAGLWVIDEGHHILKTNKWGKAVQLFPNARGLTVTATPVRADGKGLGAEFDGVIDCLVEGPPMRELIDRGFLSNYRIFAPPSDLDLSDVPLTASGDYNPEAAKRAVRRSRIIGDVVKHYLKIAPGKLGVTFATDVETASDIAKNFEDAGVPAAVLHAKTPDRVRVETVRRFAAGEIRQLVNVDLFGEGFDLPAIEAVQFARPTESYGLYSQQFGRVLRPMPGKEAALIIDHVGNVSRHWLPDAKRTWTLARRDRRARKTDPELIPVKNCVKCFRVYEAVHRVCPFCGHFPEPAARSAPEFVDGDLTELDETALARMRGEIARIDSAPKFPVHASREARYGIVKNHTARQKAQAALRDKIAWWAGWQRARGRSDSESYRRFFHGFGVDVMTAQTLGRPEATVLTAEIDKTLKDYERGN